MSPTIDPPILTQSNSQNGVPHVTKQPTPNKRQTQPHRLLLRKENDKKIGAVYVDTALGAVTLATLRALAAEQGVATEGFCFVTSDGAPLTSAQEAFESVDPLTATEGVLVRGPKQAEEAKAAKKEKKKKEQGQEEEQDEAKDEEADDADDGEEGKSAADPNKKRAAATAKSFAKFFEVERKRVEIKDCKGNPTGEEEEQVLLTFDDRCNPLKEALRRMMNMSVFYESRPSVAATVLLPKLHDLRQAAETGSGCYPSAARPAVQALAEFLDLEFAVVRERMDRMIEQGVCSFDALFYLFPKGAEFFTTADECKLGSTVDDIAYRRSCFHAEFSVSTHLLRADGRKLYWAKKTFSIPAFAGTLPIGELPLRPMDAATKAALTDRGKLYLSTAIGAHFMTYAGNGFRKSWFCKTAYKADGRVVIDGTNFSRFNPNYDFGSQGEAQEVESVPDAEAWRCWHTLPGFSMQAKKWLELRVEGLSPVVWDERAFERLVLADERKRLIKALVENSNAAMSDVITGKGGGCIFLLHGQPGTGKTLTAEAVAELLHRPLYSVGVGELGVSCGELEQKLREILEVASAWDAVVLIDEADIFLERRTESDIHRNAMVGVFLRLLEYHQGCLFLTTNRVKSFDEAFHSRISVALHYEPLHTGVRKEVWEQLLAHAGIGGLDAEALSAHPLNGRQIKNTIRLAQSLAMSEGVAVTAAHVERTVAVTAQFQSDLKEAQSTTPC